MQNTDTQKLNELHKKLKSLIEEVYLKYKESLNKQDREDCEEYLEQGEYELTISNLSASLAKEKIGIDQDTAVKISQIYNLMQIPEQEIQ